MGCGHEGQYICLKCQKRLERPGHICPMCCKPSLDGWVHPRCKRIGGIDRLLVGLPYRGMVQQLLKKVKYKSSWDIISFLVQIWQEDCCDAVLHDTVITSVPMFAQKERERGFNQAEIIAKLLAEKNKARTFVLLERVRLTRPMFGLSKRERQENVQGAFRLNVYKSETLQLSDYEKVVLVDDVWTTGATMRECARVLKYEGVKEIWGATLAR